MKNFTQPKSIKHNHKLNKNNLQYPYYDYTKKDSYR